MEQRRGRRKRVDMHAVISYERLGLLSGQVRDLSTGGLGLEAGPIVLPKDADVEVHLSLADGEEMHSCALGASVAWVSHGTMGLLFRDPAPEVSRRLYAAVYGHSDPPKRVFRKRFHG